MMYKISVIIPIYKVERYIEKCVNSVINQTFKKLEIILVNDGSPDKSPKICEEYASKDNRIKVIHKSNGGVSSARNAGLEIATGEYILFVDADDWLEQDMCEYLINNAIRYDADISCSGFYCDRTKSSDIRSTPKDIYLQSNDDCISNFLEKKYFSFCIWNKLFNRKIVMDKFDESLSIGEDGYFLFRAVLNSNKVIFGKEAKYHYNIRNNSATQSDFNIKSFGTLHFLDKIFFDISKLKPEYIEKVNSLRFNEYLAILNMMLYYEKQYEYEEQFNKLTQDLTRIYKMKKSKTKLSFTKELAFILFLINRNIYTFIITKYYSKKANNNLA